MTHRKPTGLANPYEAGPGGSDPAGPRVTARAALRLIAVGGVGAGAAGLQVIGAGAAHAEPAPPTHSSPAFLSPYE